MGAKDSLDAYKSLLATTEAALQAVERSAKEKDNLIALERQKGSVCEQQKESAFSIIRSKDEIISTQENTIKRLGSRPKMWNVSLVGGYGYSLGATVTRSPFIGIGIGRTIFKF